MNQKFILGGNKKKNIALVLAIFMLVQLFSSVLYVFALDEPTVKEGGLSDFNQSQKIASAYLSENTEAMTGVMNVEVSSDESLIVQVDGQGYSQYEPNIVSPNHTQGWLVSSLSSFDGMTKSKYTSSALAWAKFQPNINMQKAGKYNVYYDNVYTANTVQMVSSMRASGEDLPFTYPVTTVSEREWTLIGQYEFDGNGDEYVLVRGNGGLYARVSAVKFELIELADIVPIAQNIRFANGISAGAQISVAYDYVDPNNDAESGSTYTLYSADTQDAQQWNVVTSGNCSAGQAFYITIAESLKDKYIKIGITTKNNNPVDIGNFIENFSEVLGPLPLGWVKPTASNINLSNFAVLGAVLSAEYTYEDRNLDVENGSQYEWLVADSADSTNWTVAAFGECVQGDSLTFEAMPQYQDKYIKFSIQPKNDAENGVGDKAYSNIIGPIGHSAEVPQIESASYAGQVVLAENLQGAAVGGTIDIAYIYTHIYGIAEDKANTKYQWYSSYTPNGTIKPIYGETNSSYTVKEGDAGKYLKVGIKPASIDGKIGEEFLSDAISVKWRLSFNDEFEYTAANGYADTFRKKWVSDRNIRPLGTPMVYQIRIPENLEVADGKLIIHTRKEHLSNYADLDAKMAQPHDWTTGNAWSNVKVGPYGYYEARYKYAYATGLNQSFWAITRGMTNDPAPPNYSPTEPCFVELDFNEGHFPREMTNNLHQYLSNDNKVTQSFKHYPLGANSFTNIVSPNFGDDFHKFGGYYRKNDPSEAWDKGINTSNYRVFSDDKQIRSTRGSQNLTAPVVILFSIAIYPGFAGPLNADAADGSKMEVDYVRYYDPLSVTKTDLASTIQTANELTQNAVGGSNAGNYPPSVISTLQGLIPPAQAVFDKADASQEEINQSVNILSDGIDVFLAQMVGDRTQLITVVEEAEQMLVDYPSGWGYLQCEPSIHSMLADLAQQGRAVIEKPYPVQSEIDEHIQPISDMIETFLNNINYDDPATKTYTITITSSENGTTTGDGTFTVGQSVTLSATPQEGYSFEGWYNGTTKVSSLPNYTFAVTQDITLTANFVKIPKGYLEVTTVGAGSVKLNNQFGSLAPNYKDLHTRGTSITLTATAINGYSFAYWTDVNSSCIVSTNPVYQSIMGTGINVKAVFGKISTPQDAYYTVLFKDKSGKILKSTSVERGKAATTPSRNPALVGYRFIGWDKALNNVTSNLTISAVYERLLDTYTVTVENGKLSTGGTTGQFQYDLPVTVVANNAPTEQKFSHWMQDGVKVSTNSTYTFYTPMRATTLTAVFVDEDTEIIVTPFITLSTDVQVDLANKTMLFTANRTVPTGYTLIESGVLLLKSNAIPPELTVDTQNIIRGNIKNDSTNQFYIRKSNITLGDTWYGRAYLIYMDSVGNIITVYSENTENRTMGF